MHFKFDKNDALDYFGILAIACIGAKLALAAGKLLYRACSSPLNIGARFGGRWAVVTGATDGIGRAYAFELAGRGVNVVLVSRTQSKLDSVAEEIRAEHGVETRTLAVDFVRDDAKHYRTIVARGIEGLDVGILVNNVGMGYELPTRFLDIGNDVTEFAANMVRCNVDSVNNMTSLILPQMVERKSGVVVNISSFSAKFATPFMSVYSGTKAYVDLFTRGLQAEYAREGIVVQSVTPGYVVSKLSKIRRPNLIAPTPERYVKSAVGRIGVESATNGYWAHDLQEWLMLKLLPECLLPRLVYNEMSKVRGRALKKMDQQKSE